MCTLAKIFCKKYRFKIWYFKPNKLLAILKSILFNKSIDNTASDTIKYIANTSITIAVYKLHIGLKIVAIITKTIANHFLLLR